MIELEVPFPEKDEAKRLGARWNAAAKRWYVPNGVDCRPFARWLPAGFAYEFEQTSLVAANTSDREEFSLSAFLYKISDLIQRNLPGASWISAEISELRNNRGHLFITLVEHDDQGNMIARSSAKIWQNQAEFLNAKFQQGTGSELSAGLKVLVYARAEFHAQYGLSLFIEDIDPSYTLGDMAAKLAKIRETLIAEKIFELNKQLPKPNDFVRVAVISPQNAAGLGDFNREAGILQRHGLCEFVYFTATFQGEVAPREICAALDAAVAAHIDQNFDALVIIRGGGALSDLAWLNDLQLARTVCMCPIHVMAGIGHERDYTIIDEVAGERFDTPSKVIQRIFNLVTGNAVEAEANYLEITRKAQHLVQYIQTALDSMRQEVGHVANNLCIRLWERVTNLYQQLGQQAQQSCVALETQLKMQISAILSQSPQQILKKGFALVANKDQKIITSRIQAQQEDLLQIEFYDGKITVETKL